MAKTRCRSFRALWMQSLEPPGLLSPNARKPSSNARQCAVIFPTFSRPFQRTISNLRRHCLHSRYTSTHGEARCFASAWPGRGAARRFLAPGVTLRSAVAEYCLMRGEPACGRMSCGKFVHGRLQCCCLYIYVRAPAAMGFFSAPSQPLYVSAHSSEFFFRGAIPFCAPRHRAASYKAGRGRVHSFLFLGSALLHGNTALACCSIWICSYHHACKIVPLTHRFA